MKKMDEMEMSINLKAIKMAWFYTVLFLFIWIIYEFTQTGSVGLPFILLISQNPIYLLVRQILLRRMHG